MLGWFFILSQVSQANPRLSYSCYCINSSFSSSSSITMAKSPCLHRGLEDVGAGRGGQRCLGRWLRQGRVTTLWVGHHPLAASRMVGLFVVLLKPNWFAKWKKILRLPTWDKSYEILFWVFLCDLNACHSSYGKNQTWAKAVVPVRNMVGGDIAASEDLTSGC